MRVVKPNQVGILSRPYDFNNQYRLCVTGLVMFQFGEPRYPMTESALWLCVGEVLGETVLDESMPKLHGEILLAARAHAREPQKVVRVAVELDGKLLKELAVIGDREWKNDVPTEPKPFTEMPITWQKAFGGEGFKRNPIGTGFKPKDGSQLPNVEDRQALIKHPKDTPEPAGLMPYDISWPQRADKAGTYDQRWLEKFYPGLATDIDWTFFNVAPPDQRIDGFFRGDEELVFRNLHAQETELRCKLPEVQLRCFMRRKMKSGAEAESELEMKLDTLWMFPHIRTGILVWHGTAPIREDDAADVTLLCLACEDLGKPKPVEHYREVIERRIGKDAGAIASLDDKPLLPALRGEMKSPPTPYDDMSDLVAAEQLAFRNMNARRKREIDEARALLVQYGLDPDQHGPSHVADIDLSGSLEEVLARADKMDEELRIEQQKAQESLAKEEAELRKVCEQAGLDFEEIRKEWTGPGHGGPPELTAQRDIARMEGLAAEGRAAGFDVSEIDDYLANAEFMEMFYEQDRAKMEAYRVGAQHLDAPSLRTETESASLKRSLEEANRRGESLKGRNLTGANLAGVELAGADLEEALMERCNLEGANLAGANLKRAVLVRTELSGARLGGANLERANLSKANARRADFSDSLMKDAILEDTSFADAVLDGVDFERASFSDTRFERSSLCRVKAEAASFHNLDLKGTRFAKGVLRDAVFMGCDLDEADFSDAVLESATLYGCRANRTSFARIAGASLRVVEGSQLTDCDFSGARLDIACFRGTALTRSRFSEAHAPMIDFSDCDLQGAQLVRLRGKHARFIRANLSGACLEGADLYESLLSKAILHGADLRGANLYQADMAMARGDEHTKLDGALVTRVRSRPRWEDKVQDLD
jgi:uncharacterized protein YjbI with pentapeptide repeats